jgi:hypothetical protein
MVHLGVELAVFDDSVFLEDVECADVDGHVLAVGFELEFFVSVVELD